MSIIINSSHFLTCNALLISFCSLSVCLFPLVGCLNFTWFTLEAIIYFHKLGRQTYMQTDRRQNVIKRAYIIVMWTVFYMLWASIAIYLFPSKDFILEPYIEAFEEVMFHSRNNGFITWYFAPHFCSIGQVEVVIRHLTFNDSKIN
jgi:hypothetical protein